MSRIGRIEKIDALGTPLGKLVKRLVPPESFIKDALSGVWLGHSLHPLLTDIPIGAFTSVTVLDLVGGSSSRRAADRLLALGLLSSVVTAAAGAADWSDTHGDDKRTGVVHAAANAIGVGLYGASAVARRREKRLTATALGLGGITVMSVAGYLGGYLSFARGVGVNNTFLEEPPGDWTALVELDGVPDGQLTQATVDGVSIVLYRVGDRIFAIGDRCTHASGPLHEGRVDPTGCTVTCPWHDSVFRLDSGSVVHGPATVPQTSYDTRVVDGRVEVRAQS